MRTRSAVFSSLLLLATLPAQADRYDLGLRLRAFERELAATTDAARRDAAMVQLDAAVQAFFRLDTRTVMAAIDRAGFSLRTAPPEPAEQYARSLQLQLQARLVDATTPALGGELRVAYPVDVGPPPPLTLVLELAGMPAVPPCAIAVGELPLTVQWPTPALPPGDHEVRWSLRAGDRELVARTCGLSVVERLDARLAALAAAAPPDDATPTIEVATRRALTRTLQGMVRRRAEETVLPGNRLLGEAEQLLAHPADRPWYTQARAGQFWLRVPTGKATVALRLFVPGDLASERPVPLVIALHGAGGSENLFFDGYGDGEVVRQCQQRGWLLVAPRAEAFGGSSLPALVDALAHRYPIDRQRVLLIGHSMGAAQAVAAAVADPGRFAAVAPLGGGGNVRGAKGLTRLPFFVGVGTRDFARGGARTLAQQLERAKAPVRLREYDGVEHLAIVQMALPDVFAFFDATLASMPAGK